MSAPRIPYRRQGSDEDVANPTQGGPTDERPLRRREWSGALRSVLLPLLILAAIVGGLWWWESRDRSGGVDDERYGIVDLPAALNPTSRQPSTDVGRAAPDFLLERLGGGELRLSDLRGKAVLVNFWASWCPPCREELPVLVDAYQRHESRGFVVVGVNLQEADGKVHDFAREFGVDFPVVIDRDGEVADAWRLGGPVRGLPTSYFIDEHGVVRDFFYGPLTRGKIEERLAPLLPQEAR